MQPAAARRGLMIAAPSSGSGKTVVTLGLLRALQQTGFDVCGAKAGPDYIDPAFHEAASGHPSVNLDPWAMMPGKLRQLFHAQPAGHVLVEAMMGLFDGASDGNGSPADLAVLLGLPVILVIDCAKQSHSIGALARGFRDHRPEIALAGVILNRVGSARHEAMLREALLPLGLPVLGVLARDVSLALPERHLGLVQAGENVALEAFIEHAAGIIAGSFDTHAIAEAFADVKASKEEGGIVLRPSGQRIAIARDQAFSFLYPHVLSDWRRQGAELAFFSPLADEGPDPDTDAVHLPGGYPELHAAEIAMAEKFREGMKRAQERGAAISGECGGYMVLGDGLVDADGVRHAMLGMLRLETSFEKRRLHLGYRKLKGLCGPFRDEAWSAHEFHYSTVLREEGEALFSCKDASGLDLPAAGLRQGNVTGSYMHLIDRVAE